MIWPVIIFVLTLAGKLGYDLYLYFHQYHNYHTAGAIVVFTLLTMCVISTKVKKLHSVPMWFLCYWAMFDSLYGLFIGQGVFYIGTTAKLDILQNQYPVLQWLKYGLAIASVVYYILVYKKSLIQSQK